jgi:hypothetical protein
MKLKLTALALLLCLFGQAQNNLSIARVGKDKIAIYNPNYHAIAVSVGQERNYLIPAYQGIQIDFSLSNFNVEHTTFLSSYNRNCVTLDSVRCELNANQALANAENRLWRASLATSLLQGKNSGAILDIVSMLFGASPELVSEIMEAYKSNDTEEQKTLRLNKILENYYIKQSNIDQNRESCIQSAYQLLSSNTSTQKFYASQFIGKKENFRFEVAPYYVLGFNAMQYRGQTNKRPAFNEISTGQQFPVGVRASLNFNAYNKYKQRKVDKKLYLVLDYSQSPAIYKKTPDGIFKKDTAYAWNFYSLGMGWETLYRNSKGKYNSSFAFDVGVISSSNSRYATDSLKSIKTKVSGNSFKEFNIYACATLKQKVFSWVDLFASYKLSTSLFTKDANKINREIPAFRQFQIGLNFILAKAVNYQY